MPKSAREVPAWVWIVAAILLVIAVLFSISSSIFLGVGVLLAGAVGFGGYLLWTRAPERYESGADKYEVEDREQIQEEQQEEERRREQRENEARENVEAKREAARADSGEDDEEDDEDASKET